MTDPLGNATTYAYDAAGRRTSLVDPLNNTWTFSYDNEDRLIQATAPAPAAGGAPLSTSAAFDPVGNRLSMTDANGQITRYVYDVRDSLQEVDQSATASDPNADPSEIRTTYTYDNLGNLSRVLRATGDAANERATDYTYDGLNRVRTETQYPSWPSTSPALVTQTTYDPDGNRATLTDPLGQVTTFGYDTLDRLTSITYSSPAPGTAATPNVSYSYDANGNRLGMTDGTGQTTYTYDELDRLTSVASPGPKAIGYRYDLDGNRTKLIYPDGTAVTSTFNKASQLASLLDWANRTTSYSYFPDGLLNAATNLNGTTAQFSYDNARRLTQVSNQQGTSTLSQHTYTLDPVGNRTKLDDTLAQVPAGPSGPPQWEFAASTEGWVGTAGAGSTLSWQASDGSPLGGSLEAHIGGQAQSATNVWSLDRTWEQLGVPAGATVTSVRLVSIRQRTSQYTFAGATNTWQVELRDSAGATQATLLPAQIETGLDSLWSTDLSGGDQTVPSALQASNAPVRLAIVAQMSTGSTFAASAVTFRWDHVALQITYQAPTAPPPAPAPTTASTSYGYDKLYRLTSASGPAGTTTYSYDPLGNRLSKGSTSYSYDRADRITSAGSTSYTLNANGNTTARGSDSFGFDQANRLTSATTGSGSGTYAYDGDGKRVSKTVGGTTTTYVYDVSGGLPVLLDDGVRKYVWGAGGLAYSVDKTSGAVQVFHTDGLGSVRALTDSTGSVIQTYQTDEFGVPTVSQGTSTQPFGYTGEQRDPEHGLVYLRARIYDPQLGRFLQKDSMAKTGTGVGGWNRYSYVANNPIGSVDPSGLYSYRYEWYIGPVSRTGSAVSVMTYFQQHPREIFPFDLGQCDTIRIDAKCDLGVALGGTFHRDPVQITATSGTSFTFTALKGHFDPEGSTITFSVFERDGAVHLQQKAHALRPDEGSPEDQATAWIAYVMWWQQAVNLTRAVDPVYRDMPEVALA